jgi:hypothetical protein
MNLDSCARTSKQVLPPTLWAHHETKNNNLKTPHSIFTLPFLLLGDSCGRSAKDSQNVTG